MLDRALDAARRPRRVDWILDAAQHDPDRIAAATAELHRAHTRLAAAERAVHTCSHAHQLDQAIDVLRDVLAAINETAPALRRSPAWGALYDHPALRAARAITQETL